MAPTRTKTSTIGQPAQPNQSSRKGKKAWRKNIDLTTTEAFLEEQSHPLRQTASDVLFVEDRSGQETLTAKQARTKRPLKSLEILQNSYGHAALEPARKQKGGVDKKTEQRLRKMVGRQRVTTQGDASAIVQHSSEVVNKNLGSVYDVWGSSSEAKGNSKAAQDDWIPAQVSKPFVNLPKTLRRDDHDIASSLPAIDLPHPGSSYNPDLESHEALINEAYEIEKRLEKNEQMDQRERQQWQAKLATIVAREAELRLQKDDDLKRYRGMDVDVPGLASDSDSEDDNSSGSDKEGGNSEPKRKTRAQRARAKRVRAQQAETSRRKQARIEAAAILQLPALKRRQARLALARQQATQLRRQQKQSLLAKHGLSGIKVGKHTVPQQSIDVQTADELSESLRTLKPEGNLFRDRYVRLQARGKVEPRVKQERTRRGKKVKAYETHDYKKFQ
ncbi:related to Glioma tumor suppressor candidate region gene 2 protein [Sporisorium scitamineum]|uniref:Ribosome biogenesis protein NOP53 n=1 Tax=Sporisorium scitamineum TaxID=49012 RepID=A0A0F7SCT0_9BASI|nr:related to Glioma tumor suppressor candidate region gene 2 protein [Sporisorium scitamineum]CDW99469.1 hypothetical protein [Sporisorium scitamineum]